MGIMFAPDMLALVLSGKKTQTRRKVSAKDTIEAEYLDYHSTPIGGSDNGVSVVTSYYTRTHSHYVNRAKCGLVHHNNRTHWRVGNTYAVQPGRGKKSVGRIRLTTIRLERFCDISQADAIAEGFTDPAGFFAKIRELYGDGFDLSQPCWCLSFQLITPT